MNEKKRKEKKYQLLELIFGEESVSFGNQHTSCNPILNETTLEKKSEKKRKEKEKEKEKPKWGSILWNEILLISQSNVQSFRSLNQSLRNVNVHFITIKIGIISAAICVMHANCFFISQNTDLNKIEKMKYKKYFLKNNTI